MSPLCAMSPGPRVIKDIRAEQGHVCVLVDDGLDKDRPTTIWLPPEVIAQLLGEWKHTLCTCAAQCLQDRLDQARANADEYQSSVARAEEEMRRVKDALGMR